MSDNKDYITRYESDGTVNISSEVVCSIAALAACEVEGVCGLSQNRSAEIAELLGKKVLSQGVKLSVAEDSYSIECNIVLEHGYRIPEVAAKVQQKVAQAIEATTGIQVASVNINVSSISMPKNSMPKKDK